MLRRARGNRGDRDDGPPAGDRSAVTTKQVPRQKLFGTVAFFTGDPAPRFGESVKSMQQMLAYMRNDEIRLGWFGGVDVTGNLNEACRRTKGDWLWQTADDHIWEPDIIRRLEAHKVDVVVPHCLKRTPGFEPVLYGSSNGDVHQLAQIPEQGLFEVHAAGTAGMLIRKHVLDEIGDPWFETYGKQNEDLMFCRKLREHGFTIWCDPSVLLGHIALTCVYPCWIEGEGWGVDMDLGGENGDQRVLMRRLGNSLTPS
jgi:hypothetical protein